MNRDIFQGTWEETKGRLKQAWGKLTDSDLMEIEGDQQQIFGKLQQRYGYSRQEAERAVRDWQGRYH